MNKTKDKKRKYDNKLSAQLIKHDDFLLEKLKEEWEQIQKGAKREEIVRKTKEAGIFAVKTVLVLAAIAGVLCIAAVAPNVFVAFGRSRGGRRGFFNERDFKNGMRYLKNQGQIIVKNKQSNQFEISLTDTGRKVILKSAFDQLKIDKKKPWDRIWRIVAFDIPNKHKWARDGFRRKLLSLGFYRLQKSLFIIPFACGQELEFLAGIYNISGHIKLIKTQDINGDEEIKEFFGLN